MNQKFKKKGNIIITLITYNYICICILYKINRSVSIDFYCLDFLLHIRALIYHIIYAGIKEILLKIFRYFL